MTQRAARQAGPPSPSLSRDPWRYRWTVLGVATFTQAASGFFVGGLGALGVHLQRALDLSTAQLGLLVSAAQLVPPAGRLDQPVSVAEMAVRSQVSARTPTRRFTSSWGSAPDAG